MKILLTSSDVTQGLVYGDGEGLSNNALTLELYLSTNVGISSGLPRAVFNTLSSNSTVSFWNCAQLGIL